MFGWVKYASGNKYRNLSKNACFNLSIKRYLAGLRSAYYLRPKPIWIWNEYKEYKRRMSGTNTYNGTLVI